MQRDTRDSVGMQFKRDVLLHYKILNFIDFQ